MRFREGMALLRGAIPLLAQAIRSREGGQAAVEYLLATGVLAVVFGALFILIAQAAVPAVLEFACKTVDPLGDGNCLTF